MLSRVQRQLWVSCRIVATVAMQGMKSISTTRKASAEEAGTVAAIVSARPTASRPVP